MIIHPDCPIAATRNHPGDWFCECLELYQRDMMSHTEEIVLSNAVPSHEATTLEKFTYHSPSEEGVKTHASLSGNFTELACTVEALVPPGRERSLALTKLEEAKFWASAGVARNPATR